MKQIISRSLFKIRALKAYFKDYRRHINYALYCRNQKSGDKDSLRCAIMLLNHQLEKAQTYAMPKNGYGKDKLNMLLSLLEKYLPLFGHDALVGNAVGVIDSHFSNPFAYKGEEDKERYKALIDRYRLPYPPNDIGGVVLQQNEEYDEATRQRLYQLFATRKSCRLYADTPIDYQKIQRAVSIAMLSPSACNRQSIRVHYYDDSEQIGAIIRSQKSDIDWCLSAKGLFIITANEYYFRDYLERNQKMFDAGLFSMSLDLALHSLGIGTCFKMAQKAPAIDMATKVIAGIPEHEDICVLLVAGNYPDKPFAAAKSTRLSENDIFTRHE